MRGVAKIGSLLANKPPRCVCSNIDRRWPTIGLIKALGQSGQNEGSLLVRSEDEDWNFGTVLRRRSWGITLFFG
jgi:hypothetical protein